MDIQNLRWWGWGTQDQDYSLEGRTRFWPEIERMLELPSERVVQPPVPLDEIDLRPPRLDEPMLASLSKLLGEGALHTDKLSRVEHAYGKSYRDLVRIRAGHIPNPPDAVVYPADEGKVAALLTWAADREVNVVPFGGGSTVTGGVEPASSERPIITLDTARLDRMISLDPISWTARLQAGATGPEVERALNAQGFSLGQFPQSFEFSTLGGWIVTRGAGQNSVGYGKIEKMTQAVRVVTPMGIMDTLDVPATAAGPSMLGLLMGSEGTYGVLTEATMHVHPLAEVEDYRGILFRSLEDGLAAYRALMQSTLHPSIIRLSDPSETEAYAIMGHEHHGLRAVFDKGLGWYLRQRGYAPGSGACLMILGFDGDLDTVAYQWGAASELVSDHRGLSLGRAAGESWKRDRYAQPYLRDMLLGHGVLVDTLETATTWSNLPRLYEAMTRALKSAIQSTGGGPGLVMTHVSHAYPYGASLYSTYLGRQVSRDPLENQEQWFAIKRSVSEAIVRSGGTISHHHGIGLDHRAWLEEEIGPLAMNLLGAIKDRLDPMEIMNPGILLER